MKKIISVSFKTLKCRHVNFIASYFTFIIGANVSSGHNIISYKVNIYCVYCKQCAVYKNIIGRGIQTIVVNLKGVNNSFS